MDVLNTILELMKFMFSLFITYNRNKRLARLTDHLAMLNNLPAGEAKEDIKKYLEQEIIDLILLIEIGTSKKEYQQKFIAVKEKCRGSGIEGYPMRIFMPYTKMDGGKLSFTSSFLKQSILAYIIMFASIVIVSILISSISPITIRLTGQIILSLLFAMVVFECSHYYSTFILYKKDYIKLISAD